MSSHEFMNYVEYRNSIMTSRNRGASDVNWADTELGYAHHCQDPLLPPCLSPTVLQPDTGLDHPNYVPPLIPI